MILSEEMYVPALRWRQGEYQALWRLSPAVKDQVMPLITIPPVEFDFEQWRPKKSTHEHVHPFCARYDAKWGKRPAWIALDTSIAEARMDDASHIFDYVLDGLRVKEATAIPALPVAADSHTISAVKRATAADRRGAGVILRLEDLMAENPRKALLDFAASLGIDLDALDVVLDLRAPNFEPYDVFASALAAAIRALGNLHEVRNFVLLGTAIPESLAQLAKGSDKIPRHDWLFFKQLVAAMPAGVRRPNYGDHTIVHPGFTAMDMRKVKAAGKIIYTTPSTWATRKGGAFRDNPSQMHAHCEQIVSDPAFAFRGANFSYGDQYIADCAGKAAAPSNLSRWKEVAINHHITTVADDLATLLALP